MRDLQPKSNIANKVRNTKLPIRKPLMPLFEVISNSIHAIVEAQKEKILQNKGEVRVIIIRNGAQTTLEELPSVDEYPIKSFIVSDNGIGLNDENLNFFIESDTDHKIKIGGKGVGRFVCLKAFDQLVISSNYGKEGALKNISFTFNNTKEGFRDLTESASVSPNTGTTILLSNYKLEFRKHVPRQISQIAEEIVTHFQLYFIQKQAPSIILENQNKDFIDCQTYYSTNLESKVINHPFNIGDYEFTIYLTKSFSAQSHKISFCAHNRTVKEEGLYNRIIDLGKHPITDDDGHFYYQAFVVGEVLDDNVDSERIGFNFPSGDDEDDSQEELTLSKIRKGAVGTIEYILADYLNKVRTRKIDNYIPIIKGELPQYNYLFNHKIDEVKKLQPNLTKEKLDVELYKIETNWKVEVKEEGTRILDEKKDIQNLDDYKIRYEKFLEAFNEVGKAELARYVVHRKAVIQLLDKLLDKTDDSKFSDEDVLHSIFFPIRTTSDEIAHDKQNLWLIDEKLTYHSFLASDKRFDQIKQLDVKNADRTDLLIFNDALAFSEDAKAPFQSFTIVEFKKPQRDNYQDYDPAKNPLDQVEKYIQSIIAGKVESKNGRKIIVDPRIPFYVYIICDLNNSLITILRSREFDRTPDGMGYFKFYSRYFNAYIEVLPFEKVLSDAQKRNRILFEKLGIPQ